ncbi:hypothetical protein STENM223S_06007 [Streptomyces tendae]
MRSAAKGVEAGRRAVVATSGQVAAGARTAWTVIAQRKFVAAGVGAGLTVLSAASYAVGRHAARPRLSGVMPLSWRHCRSDFDYTSAT